MLVSINVVFSGQERAELTKLGITIVATIISMASVLVNLEPISLFNTDSKKLSMLSSGGGYNFMAKKSKMAPRHQHHHSHPEAKVRLKRASGHLVKVIDMVHEGKGCTDILQQLTAVISALESCRVTLLQDHIRTCIAPIVPADAGNVVKDLELVIRRAMK